MELGEIRICLLPTFSILIFYLRHFSSLQRNPRAKKTSVPSIEMFGATSSPRELKSLVAPKQLARRKMSDPDIHYGTNVLANLVSLNKSVLQRDGNFVMGLSVGAKRFPHIRIDDNAGKAKSTAFNNQSKHSCSASRSCVDQPICTVARNDKTDFESSPMDTHLPEGADRSVDTTAPLSSSAIVSEHGQYFEP